MKKSILKSIILLAVLLALFALLPLFFFKSDNETLIKWSDDISITDRTLDKTSTSVDFTIDETGEYSLYISLIPDGFDKDTLMNVNTYDIGFITATLVQNSAGDVVYSNVAGAVFLDTTINLAPDNYKLTHYYFSDEEELYNFISTYICSTNEARQISKSVNFPAFKDQGSTSVNYEFSFAKTDASYVRTALIVIWGIIVGIVFAFFLLELFVTDADKQKYDERQRLEQGKAFKLGFFTLLITTGMLAVFDLSHSHPGESYGIYYVMALFVSISVYIAYCIWTESYFAINQNTTKVLIFFALISILNLAISIVNIYHGLIFVNGHLTFRVLNIMCALLFVVVFITTLIRKMVNAKKAASDEEDDEEDE